MRAEASKAGLHICFRNRFITSLSGDENDYAEIFAKNLEFPAKMRELFGLAGKEGYPPSGGSRWLSEVCNQVTRNPAYTTRRTTTNHAFGPPSLKVKSFRSGRTS